MVVYIEKNIRGKNGSIYYDRTRKKWRCAFYVYKEDTFEEIRKTKSFNTESEANDFLTGLQFQKGNDLYIKYNGIPLNKLMRENAERKLEANLIGERTYGRILKTIKLIEKNPNSTKNIYDIAC